jgi:hypothetical protein
MTGQRILIAAALLSLAARPAGQARSADVVAVCPQQFHAALQAWVDHRRSEGLVVRVIESSSDAATLQARIRAAADADTRYVLLVGDAPVIGTPCDHVRQTPILYSPTKVTAAWGSTPTLSSDLWFGDFDQDQLPEAVVGRLPVDEPRQLERLIERIVAHEQSRDFGPWRSHVQLVSGMGGFGAMTDGAIESVTRSIVTGVLPVETRTTVAHACPGHAFFPDQASFTEAVLERYEQGARFWVYAGHGQVTELDRVPNHAGGIPVLDQHSVQRLNRPAQGSPIALMLACYAGALDASEDSIAERMVLCNGGPIAVLAGSRVTMPYGNTTAAVGLINGIFVHKLPRLGDAWRSTLFEMHREVPDDTSATRLMIDALASVVSPAGTSLVDERREHMLLYNLIGDPTLRLNHPHPLELRIPPGHDCGKPIEFQIDSPIDGELTVSVDRPLGAVTEGDPNATTIASIGARVEAGKSMSAAVNLPERFRGPIVVRALVAGERAWASAAARAIVR